MTLSYGRMNEETAAELAPSKPLPLLWTPSCLVYFFFSVHAAITRRSPVDISLLTSPIPIPPYPRPTPHPYPHPARASLSVGQLWWKGQRCSQGGNNRRHSRRPFQGHGGAITARGHQALVHHHSRPRPSLHFCRCRRIGCLRDSSPRRQRTA